MEEPLYEDNNKEMMSVNQMSKWVFAGILILVLILSIVDITKSVQGGIKPWIGRYFEEHYSYLFTKPVADAAPALVEISDEIEEEMVEEPVVEDNSNYPFDAEGFIFSSSNAEYLNEEMLDALRYVDGFDFGELLGFARNEIYARHGFPFNVDGKYYAHYSQYEWYNSIEHNDVPEENLNQYEKANIDFIVSVEEREGYR